MDKGGQRFALYCGLAFPFVFFLGFIVAGLFPLLSPDATVVPVTLQAGTYTHEDVTLPRVEAMTADTIFDCASLTKVVATTSSVMKLFEQGKHLIACRLRLEQCVVQHGGKAGWCRQRVACKTGSVKGATRRYGDLVRDVRLHHSHFRTSLPG